MVLPLSEFVWDVPPAGLGLAVAPEGEMTPAEWATPGSAGADLECLLIPKSSEPPRSYEPLAEQPGLFLRFTDLAETEEAVVAFASRFGPLVRPHLPVRPPWNPKTLVPGTRLKWRPEIRILKEVVTLHAAIDSQDFHAIDGLLDWAGTSVTLRTGGTWRLSRIHLTAGETTLSARLAVAKRVRDHAVDSAFQTRATLRLPDRAPAYRPKMSDGKVQLVPVNLLGAMWLQFAVAIEDGNRYKRCEARNCPLEWFKVSGLRGVREDAEFCSPKCRHTAYRDRKNRATEMHRSGVPISQIAKSLKTDTQRVRTWTAKKKK